MRYSSPSVVDIFLNSLPYYNNTNTYNNTNYLFAITLRTFELGISSNSCPNRTGGNWTTGIGRGGVKVIVVVSSLGVAVRLLLVLVLVFGFLIYWRTSSFIMRFCLPDPLIADGLILWRVIKKRAEGVTKASPGFDFKRRSRENEPNLFERLIKFWKKNHKLHNYLSWMKWCCSFDTILRSWVWSAMTKRCSKSSTRRAFGKQDDRPWQKHWTSLAFGEDFVP